MKNHKSFELYRPNQLVDFLNFLKDNPEETFVYILIKPQTEERFYFDRYTSTVCSQDEKKSKRF